MLWKPSQDFTRAGTGVDPSFSYIGTVVDNSDPQQLSRVRVRVQALHGSEASGVPDSKLPWARQISLPFIGTTALEGTSSGGGFFGVPAVGTQVELTFPQGDIYAPQYSGAPMHAQSKVAMQQAEDYPSNFGFTSSEEYTDDRSRINKIFLFLFNCREQSTTNLCLWSDLHEIRAINQFDFKASR